MTVFVGNFGSGKTEIALNYALALTETKKRVQLVDLDVINPYFRSREARDFVASCGVEVVAPVNEYAYADLPILLREVAGTIGTSDGYVVFDVGGDDLGARALGGFSHTLSQAQALVLQVVNQRRPFTDSSAGCRKMYAELEAASRLKIGGLVANAHLIDETTADVVAAGVDFTRDIGSEVGVGLLFAAVAKNLVTPQLEQRLGCPVLQLQRMMTAPWEQSSLRAPIGRPNKRGPIGRPPSVVLPSGVK